MKNRLFVVVMSLAVTASALPAQDTPSPAQPAAAIVQSADDQLQGSGVTGEKGKETLSVDFPNAEIRTILRNIADLFDLNLVIPEALEGRASLKLRDVTWKQIFDVLLTPVGYTYVTDGNIIKVVSVESLMVEPAETRIFILNYSRAAEIAPTVNSMIEPAKGGKMQVDTRSNGLVVTERPKRLEKIDEIIKRLDRPTEQVMIETKFIEISDRDVKNIGVNWASLNGYGIGLGPVKHDWTRGGGQTSKGQADTTNDHLVNDGDVNIQDAATITGEAGTVNARWRDNLTGQTIMDVTTDSSTEVIKSTVKDLTQLVNTGNTSRLTSAVFNADQFRIVLSALKTLNETRLVSNPTVVTMNNTEALISIGERFPIPSYTYNPERGTFEVSNFEYQDIGITMKVTPQVNNARLITLKVEPEVSSRAGTTSFGGASGAEIPIIASRRTSTQVALMDGYTMGIGGLIENSTQGGSSKVPVLGDIPGLGKMFRSSSKDNSKRNLVIFITAKILSPEGATYNDVFPQATLERMGVTDNDVPRAPGVSR